MEPNYNFENEISDQWSVKNHQFRDKANKLLTKYKTISKKEYDVIMWVCCNLPMGSELKINTIEMLNKLIISAEKTEIRGNQLTIKL